VSALDAPFEDTDDDGPPLNVLIDFEDSFASGLGLRRLSMYKIFLGSADGLGASDRCFMKKKGSAMESALGILTMERWA